MSLLTFCIFLLQDARRLPKQQQQQDQQDASSDDITSSWNLTASGSLLHRPGGPRRQRKSPEGSSTGSTVADSGFSTEKDSSAMLSSPAVVAAGGRLGAGSA